MKRKEREIKMMNRTELTMEQMNQINGGTLAEADALLALAKEKGWSKGNSVTSRRLASDMCKAIRIVSINWHGHDDKPAEFKDANGSVYSFEEILQDLLAQPAGQYKQD